MTIPRCRLFQQLALNQRLTECPRYKHNASLRPLLNRGLVLPVPAGNESETPTRTKLCARTAPRPFRHAQTNAGRWPGGERVLTFAGPWPCLTLRWLDYRERLGSKNIAVFTGAAQQNKSLPAGQPQGVCSPDDRRAAPGTPARPGRDLPGARFPSRPRWGTRGRRSLHVSCTWQGLGALLTCKHTRGKGDPQHRRPDGHFLGHAEKRHCGAGSRAAAPPGTRGAGRCGAVRSAPGRGRAARGGGPAALRFVLVPQRGPPFPACWILGSAGVLRGVTHGTCAPSSRWHTQLWCVKWQRQHPGFVPRPPQKLGGWFWYSFTVVFVLKHTQVSCEFVMGSHGGAFHRNMLIRGLVLQLAREVSSLLPLEHRFLCSWGVNN